MIATHRHLASFRIEPWYNTLYVTFPLLYLVSGPYYATPLRL